ncbi:hypothetical protein C5167_004291 [Papaver somniferum]|nr:hypothetical protein C5167_004291 [Papaver somniferum]
MKKIKWDSSIEGKLGFLIQRVANKFSLGDSSIEGKLGFLIQWIANRFNLGFCKAWEERRWKRCPPKKATIEMEFNENS